MDRAVDCTPKQFRSSAQFSFWLPLLTLIQWRLLKGHEFIPTIASYLPTRELTQSPSVPIPTFTTNKPWQRLILKFTETSWWKNRQYWKLVSAANSGTSL